MNFIVVGPDTDITFVLRSKSPLEDTHSVVDQDKKTCWGSLLDTTSSLFTWTR